MVNSCILIVDSFGQWMLLAIEMLHVYYLGLKVPSRVLILYLIINQYRIYIRIVRISWCHSSAAARRVSSRWTCICTLRRRITFICNFSWPLPISLKIVKLGCKRDILIGISGSLML